MRYEPVEDSAVEDDQMTSDRAIETKTMDVRFRSWVSDRAVTPSIQGRGWPPNTENVGAGIKQGKRISRHIAGSSQSGVTGTSIFQIP